MTSRRPSRIGMGLVLVFTAAMGYVGCTDGSELAAPTIDMPEPNRAISDAVHSGGNRHFFWLPPMVGHPGSFNGPFDGEKQPAVRICVFENAACASTVTEFTMATGPGSETVRLDAPAESYVVNWHTDQFEVGPGPTYRIEVRVAGTLLGYADVQLAQNGKEAKNLTTNDVIGLKDGRTLPIQFRIEEGAVFVVSATEGGTVTALGGAATLEVPPGAVEEETGITVELLEPTEDAAAVVDFGPDGLQFTTPVPVTIGYDPAWIPAGVPEEALALNLLVDGRWIVLPGSTVDPETNTVSAPFHHFSTGGAGAAELAIFCSGDDNPDTFETLSEAVAAVMDGGTVEVCDGTHAAEGVAVDRPVTIRAAVGTSPVLQTSTSLSALIVDGVTSGTVLIEGLTFDFDTPNPTPDGSATYALRVENTWDQVVVRSSTFQVDPAARGGINAWGGSSPSAALVIDDVDFQGGVFGAALNSLNAQVTNTRVSGVSGIGIGFGDLHVSSSTGRIENSVFDGCGVRCVQVTGDSEVEVLANDFSNCGSGHCVAVFLRSRVDVLSNTFTSPAPTGDSGPDLDQVIRIQSGSTALIQNNDFFGCGYFRCVFAIHDGTSMSVEGNRFTLDPLDPGLATFEHAVIMFSADAAGEALDNQITGCWSVCMLASVRSTATLRGNTITIPPGSSQVSTAILGVGGSDPAPGVVPDPAEAPTLVIENNVIDGQGLVGDPNDPTTYPIVQGIWLNNTVATALTGNTLRRAGTGIASIEGSDIQVGRDNVVESTQVAVVTTAYAPWNLEPGEDDGRATLRFNDVIDAVNALWVRPGDTASDLTCNYWGSATGEPLSFMVTGIETAVYTPWAIAPLAGTSATTCDGGPAG